MICLKCEWVLDVTLCSLSLTSHGLMAGLWHWWPPVSLFLALALVPKKEQRSAGECCWQYHPSQTISPKGKVIMNPSCALVRISLHFPLVSSSRHGEVSVRKLEYAIGCWLENVLWQHPHLKYQPYSPQWSYPTHWNAQWIQKSTEKTLCIQRKQIYILIFMTQNK